jgi:serine/threonine protein kinase
MRATQMGMILGTAAYMAPEQAKGKTVDRRADIWAFGVVLFEMLSGKQLFTGDTAAEIMASALKEEPKLDHLPAAGKGRLQHRRKHARPFTRRRAPGSHAARRGRQGAPLHAPAESGPGNAAGGHGER